jgi:formate dehydrogenase major subunit
MEKTVLDQGRPTEIVRTTCAYCGVGCAMDAGVRDGRVVSRPMLRKGQEWKAISWEAALDQIAREFARLIKESGPDAVAAISSSRGTNEENYLFGKFMRCVVGTNHIDNCARFATAPP